MLDPLISYENNNGVRRYTYADLPATIDYVLLTHNHQDHCVLETLLQLRHKIRNIVVPKSNGGLAEDSQPIIESNKLVAECHRRGIESERLFGYKEIIL